MDNLGCVEVSEGPHEERVFGKAWFSALELSGHDKHRFHSSHPPVVVVLAIGQTADFHLQVHDEVIVHILRRCGFRVLDCVWRVRTESTFESHLLAEQFLKKRVKPVELGGECLGLHKSFRHQHVLADEDQVGNHDCDGPEQHLVHAGCKRGSEEKVSL